MKNQYQLQESLPYETIKNLDWAVKNKELVAIYEKLLNNKKILYLLSIEKTEVEVAEIMGKSVRMIQHIMGRMARVAGCKGKLGLIKIAYKFNIIN